MLTPSENALAEAVLLHGPISRSALTSRLGLSAASLTRLAKPFLDTGLLVELDDVSDGSVGRPSRPLDISPDGGFFVGIKLTGHTLHAVMTDVRAGLVAASTRPLTGTDVSSVVSDIRAAVDDFDGDIRGLGVSLGGSIEDGTVEFAPFLEWRDVPFATMLTEATGLPVTIENDLVALAEAERWFGAGRGLPGFSVITIGEGIGYAVVAHNEVVRTREVGAGLGGHIPLAANGPLCDRGHRGCAQAMLTSGSLTTQISGALQRRVEYDEFLCLAASGDPAAVAVAETAGEALGRFIALAANLTMQPAVVLAGDGIGLFAVAEPAIRRAIAVDRDPLAEPIELVVDEPGFTAWARGAAAVAIQSAVAALSLAR
ncbi:ROK family transcriptional regulator [Pseudoclavibacter chungangensis]|uniref:ROK family transcriptional regulator n=1 Tax=Pseudoclavibacter chungangensis TaxID=587635 RepID=A0A7J5BRB5_9MICO|nr:ROK family transcriptional regulator [Pseudoclavibacter chungangensis]KAB1656285.1 ROK family transcriptional regulator [Pseudoclavibacter chungangensis]NYJ67045.1 putative NBD/HSP70 family sugar kinase [Pseudoclavibacter chungangensis]